jgi:hypothetical protein
MSGSLNEPSPCDSAQKASPAGPQVLQRLNLVIKRDQFDLQGLKYMRRYHIILKGDVIMQSAAVIRETDRPYSLP